MLTLTDALDNLVNRLRLLRPLLGELKLVLEITQLPVLILDVAATTLELVLLKVEPGALVCSLLLLLPEHGLKVLDSGAKLRPLLEQFLRSGLDLLDFCLQLLFLLNLLTQEFLELLFMFRIQFLLLDLLLVQQSKLTDVYLHLISLGLQQALLRLLEPEIRKLCIAEIAYTILLFPVTV